MRGSRVGIVGRLVKEVPVMGTWRGGICLGVLVFTITLPTLAWAQGQDSGSLVGELVSADGEPLPGISVILGERERMAASGDDGSFRFDDVSVGRHQLVFSLLGCDFGSQMIDVDFGRETEVRVVLGHRIVRLEGVLVTVPSLGMDRAGLPSTRDAGAPRAVRPEAARTVADLVRGVSGGRVVQGSGLPGSDTDVLLRGPVSIGGAEQRPLVVVDGIVVGHSAGDIDPMDVERVEVLKGAAASAVYGSRAHGGAIEVTTRRRPTEREPRPQGPLFLVDGEVSDASLGDLDTREILDIRMLQGPSALLIAGRRGEAGIISVTTINSPDLVGSCPEGLKLRQATVGIPEGV